MKKVSIIALLITGLTIFGLLLTDTQSEAYSASPQGGNYFDLNKSTKYATAPDSTSLDVADQTTEELTLETWIYIRQIPTPAGSGEVLIAGKLGAYEMSLTSYILGAVTYPSISFLLSNAIKYTVTPISTPISLNAWHHISISIQRSSIYNKFVMLISIDGNVSGGSNFYTGTINNTSLPFALGGKNISGVAFDGLIDEVRVSDVARYPGIFNSSSSFTRVNFTPPSSPFTTDANTRALWHFDESVGSISFADSSANANTLTIFDSSQIPAKTTPPASANVWNIIGPSVITLDKSIVNNFGEGFGTTWIAWRWNSTLARWEVPATVGSNPTTSDPFDAGTSWFYAVDGDGSYVTKSVQGTQVDASTSFSVLLKAGWNLICNPFDFSVAWSDSTIKIKYGLWEGTPTQAKALVYVDNRAIWYDPETKAYVTRYSDEATPYAMPKTRGQWLYSVVDGAYVVFPPIEYTGSPAPPSKPEMDSSLWKIELALRSSKGNDIVEAIADNKEQTGLCDVKPPSLPISTSNISFIRDDNELSSDRQKESNEMIWIFEVNASEDSSLGWKLVGIPDDYKLTLEDETGKQIDIKQISNLPIGKVGNGRYILKATRVLAPKVTRLLANYPNPFNPETWIPYELSEGSEVVIKIYTSSGNLVRTLNLGSKEAGYYTTQSKSAYWDGKNENGERVSSGIYFYSIKTAKYTSTRKMVIAK